MGNIDKRMLVLEDLRKQKFKSVKSTHGLDSEHTKLSLSLLAKWHAGTATLLFTVSLMKFFYLFLTLFDL